MAAPTFRDMIEAATKRSAEADENWSRDPVSSHSPRIKRAIHKYQSYDPETKLFMDEDGKYIPPNRIDFPEEKPEPTEKPAEWGSW